MVAASRVGHQDHQEAASKTAAGTLDGVVMGESS